DVRQRRLSRLRAGRRDGTGGEATRRGGSGREARANGPGRRAPSRARGGGSETCDDPLRLGPRGWADGEDLHGVISRAGAGGAGGWRPTISRGDASVESSFSTERSRSASRSRSSRSVRASESTASIRSRSRSSITSVSGITIDAVFKKGAGGGKHFCGEHLKM